jgi:hypothetical protein
MQCNWLNHTPPKKVIEERRAFLDEVYAHLRQRLEDLPPPSEVQEQLMRIRLE